MLVCEGACNPGTREWKRWRDGVRRRWQRAQGVMRWPEGLVRAWVHTPHQRVVRRYRCTVCGAVRAWG